MNELEAAMVEREAIREEYWDIMEALGEITLRKADINNRIQELIRKQLHERAE